MLKRPQILLVSFLLLSQIALAQNVQVTTEVDTHQAAVGNQITMSITVRGEVNESEEPNFPPLEAFSVQQAGVSRQMSIINGVASAASVYTYILVPNKPGHFTIPPVSIEVNGQTMHTQPLVLDIASGGGSPQMPSNPAFSYPRRRPRFPRMPGNDPWAGLNPTYPYQEPAPQPLPPQPPKAQGPMVLVEAEINNRTPYVNQPVVYTFRFLHRVNLDGNPSFEPPNPTGFLHDDLGQKTLQAERQGSNYSVSEAKFIYFPLAAGPFSLGPTRLSCRLNVDDIASAELFSVPEAVRELVAEAIPVTVRPLPSKNRPSDFSGAVGNFGMTVSLDKSRVEQGQPVTLRLDITGDGHPDLISDPTMPVSDDFKFYTAKSDSSVTHNGEYRSKKTFQIPVVPMKAGSLRIPPINFSYFDPREGRYQTITSQPLNVQVTPSSNPAVLASATPTPGITPGDSPQARDEAILRGPKPLAEMKGKSPEIPSWLWALQLIPWLILAGYESAKVVRSWWTARVLAHQTSNLGKSAGAALRRLPKERIEEASTIIYAYLEAKLGVKLAGVSLQEVGRHLTERGVSGDAGRELPRLLADLEAYRYAPQAGSDGNLAGELRERAEQLVLGLEKSLR